MIDVDDAVYRALREDQEYIILKVVGGRVVEIFAFEILTPESFLFWRWRGAESHEISISTTVKRGYRRVP